MNYLIYIKNKCQLFILTIYCYFYTYITYFYFLSWYFFFSYNFFNYFFESKYNDKKYGKIECSYNFNIKKCDNKKVVKNITWYDVYSWVQRKGIKAISALKWIVITRKNMLLSAAAILFSLLVAACTAEQSG
jgi:hypothetical protein